MTERQPEPREGGRWSLLERLLLVAVALLSGLNAVGTPDRSLWLDESLTWWAVDGSLGEMAWRSVEFQGQLPVFFFLEWLSVHLFGASEVALRAPSVLALLAATVVVGRIGWHLAGREAGLFAAMAFQGLWGTRNGFGTPDARPYALAVLLVSLAVLALVRWWETLDGSALRDHVLAMLGAVYAHVLFASALLVSALSLGWDARSPEARRAWTRPALLLAAGMIPPILLVLHLATRWDLYAFSPMPTPRRLVLAWLSVLTPVVVLGLPALVGRWVGELRWTSGRIGAREWTLLGAWGMLPPLVLFTASHLRGASLFVPRYFSWQIPGVALLSAVIVGRFHSPRIRATAAAGYIAVFALLRGASPGYWSEDWRGAVALVNERISPGETPVFVWSGLVEATDLTWVKDPARHEYLLAPVRFYGLRGDLTPVPGSQAATRLGDFMDSSQEAALREADEIWVVSRGTGALDAVSTWLGTGADVIDTWMFGSIAVARMGNVNVNVTDADAGSAP